MALPTADAVKDAVETLSDVFADDKTRAGTRTGIQKLNELIGVLNRIYGAVTDIAVTDATDADVAAFIGGGEGDALSVGDAFRNTGTGDLTDNALETAKGSALAANDVFVVDSGTSVAYLGNMDVPRYFDFSGETSGDFVSLGS